MCVSFVCVCARQRARLRALPRAREHVYEGLKQTEARYWAGQGEGGACEPRARAPARQRRPPCAGPARRAFQTHICSPAPNSQTPTPQTPSPKRQTANGGRVTPSSHVFRGRWSTSSSPSSKSAIPRTSAARSGRGCPPPPHPLPHPPHPLCPSPCLPPSPPLAAASRRLLHLSNYPCATAAATAVATMLVAVGVLKTAESPRPVTKHSHSKIDVRRTS